MVNRLLRLHIGLMLAALVVGGCTIRSDVTWDDSNRKELVGAWRSQVQFETGVFAAVKDLEFLYVFNPDVVGRDQPGDGGTMTESSNYDASPPVPPAYGVWRRVGPREFEAKYLFYTTKPPTKFDEITGGGGWAPAGHGELNERIMLSSDGQSFTSTIRFDSFDVSGRPTPDGGTARGSGMRVKFEDKATR